MRSKSLYDLIVIRYAYRIFPSRSDVIFCHSSLSSPASSTVFYSSGDIGGVRAGAHTQHLVSVIPMDVMLFGICVLDVGLLWILLLASLYL